jgi:hypothetical protein
MKKIDIGKRTHVPWTLETLTKTHKPLHQLNTLYVGLKKNEVLNIVKPLGYGPTCPESGPEAI